MDMEPYLLKLKLPRETRELDVNGLYCYCKTHLPFSRKLQDNRIIFTEFSFTGVTGPYHSLRILQFQNKTKTLSPHFILHLSHRQLE